MSVRQELSEPLSLSDSYPAIPATVPLVRQALVDFARRLGAADEPVEALRLAASEAITNVVRHAYDGRPGLVHVTAALTGEELWVLIGDDGHGLEAHSDQPGLGMGLALIACVSDYFAIMRRASGGTEVRMRFRLTAPRRMASHARSIADGDSVSPARSAA